MTGMPARLRLAEAAAIGMLTVAVAWFADRGAIVERVSSENGSADKSDAWLDS